MCMRVYYMHMSRSLTMCSRTFCLCMYVCLRACVCVCVCVCVYVCALLYRLFQNKGSFLRANTAITQMLSAYAKRGQGLSILRDILQSPLQQITANKTLNLEVDPIRVKYKRMCVCVLFVLCLFVCLCVCVCVYVRVCVCVCVCICVDFIICMYEPFSLFLYKLTIKTK